MMVHYRKDENGNIILSEYMFNRLMKQAYNKEKENKILNNIIKDIREMAEEKSREEIFGWSWEILRIIRKGSDK